MDNIEHIYYINLDYRADRDGLMRQWLEESGVPDEKVTRISAIHTPGRGHIGCLMSHTKALEAFLASSAKICVIFEDDYEPSNISTFWSTIKQVFASNISFDALLLAHNVLKCEDGPVPYLKRVHESLTASGYVVTREFAQKLHSLWKDGIQKGQEEEARTRHKTNTYLTDTLWTILFKTNIVYTFEPRLGFQRSSYSDIQQQYTDYKA